jgi:hypothetical protein
VRASRRRINIGYKQSWRLAGIVSALAGEMAAEQRHHGENGVKAGGRRAWRKTVGEGGGGVGGGEEKW